MTNYTKRCAICGAEFSIRPNEPPTAFEKRRTCSRRCGAYLRWGTRPGNGRLPITPEQARQAEALRAKRHERRDEIARRMAMKRAA